MGLLRSTARRARTLTRAATRTVASTALVLAGTLAVGGCIDSSGPENPDREQFSFARNLWETNAPASYDYVLVRRCIDCPDDRATRPVAVQVRAGAVTSRVYAGSTVAVPAGETTYYPSIDGLFEELEGLLASPLNFNRVSYNGGYGYPLSVVIVPKSTNDEIGWEIRSFTPVGG